MAKTRRAQNHGRAHQRARDKDNGVGQAVAKLKPPGRRGPKKIGVHGRRSDLYDVAADYQAHVYKCKCAMQEVVEVLAFMYPGSSQHLLRHCIYVCVCVYTYIYNVYKNDLAHSMPERKP